MHKCAKWFMVAAALVLLAIAGRGAPPEPKLTPDQLVLVKERDQAQAEMMANRKKGDFKAAVAPAKRVLAAERKLFGDAHADVMESWRIIARLNEAAGDNPAAAAAAEKHPETAVKLHGKDHWKTTDARLVVDDIRQTANLSPAARQRVAEANGQLRQAIQIFNQGRIREAIALLEQGIPVLREVLGDTHFEYGIYTNNLGYMYSQAGEYVRAQEHYAKALAVAKAVYGPAHPSYATRLDNLGLQYSNFREYAKAELLLVEALEVRRKLFDTDHPDVASSMNNLGLLYSNTGDVKRAEVFYKGSLAIRRRTLKPDNPSLATSLDNLGRLYAKQEKFALAEPLHQEALDIRRKAYGKEHAGYAHGLNNFGLLYSSMGDHVKAEKFYRESLEIRRKALGEEHPDYADTLSNLTGVYILTGEFAKAEAAATISLAAMRTHLARTAAGLSEQGQLGYQSRWRFHLDALLFSGLATRSPPAARYAEVLAWKGAAFSRRSRLRAAVERSGNPELQSLFDEAGRVARQIANMTSTAPAPAQAAAYRKSVRELTDRKEELEKELARLSEPFRAERSATLLTPEALAASLPDDVALFDLVQYAHFKTGPGNRSLVGEWRFVGYVVRRGQPIVEVDLGPAQPIADAVDAWRLTLGRSKPVTGPTDPALVLRDRVWLPLAKHLGGAKVALISPDGTLGKVPFAALPGTGEGKYLVEELGIAIVPVPRLLPEALARPSAAGDPSLLLVGDVDYEAEAGLPAAGTLARAGARSSGSGKWVHLDGTRDEVAAIRTAFGERFRKGNVTALAKGEATEAAVRRLAGASSHLHIATHGFFAGGKERGPRPMDDRERAVEGHPGLLSGLVLAGANRPSDPLARTDDGLLTALEVSEMDLSRVELAVLSACETRLGKEVGGEGTLGLERAFQVAGARTTVTSLWKVPDRATQELMTRFYGNLWAKDRPGRVEAIRAAQLWMLNEGAADPGLKRGAAFDGPEIAPAKDGRLPPYYWAAFVLSGDWR